MSQIFEPGDDNERMFNRFAKPRDPSYGSHCLCIFDHQPAPDILLKFREGLSNHLLELTGQTPLDIQYPEDLQIYAPRVIEFLRAEKQNKAQSSNLSGTYVITAISTSFEQRLYNGLCDVFAYERIKMFYIIPGYTVLDGIKDLHSRATYQESIDMETGKVRDPRTRVKPFVLVP